MARTRLRVVADDTDLLDEFEPYRRRLRALGRSEKTIDTYEDSLRVVPTYLTRQGRPTSAPAITPDDILGFLLDRRQAVQRVEPRRLLPLAPRLPEPPSQGSRHRDLTDDRPQGRK